MEAIATDPAKHDPTQSRWRVKEGDEIVPGLSALKLLGGGLRYEAYLAWYQRLQYVVVVKVVRPELVDDDHTIAGLTQEVEMLDRLNHPVLTRAFGAELEGPRPHVILEHLEGPRLSTLLRKYGPLPAEQLLPLGLQLAAAVHYMGTEGVVHLDIKPSNIIMGAPARLIDLSVAETIDDAARLRSAVGTDSYMSPEQALKGKGATIGPPSDVWAIGLTLYHAANGKRPFDKGDRDSDDPEVRWPQINAAPTPMPGSIPPAVAEPIMACLAYDPADRPGAVELAEALEPLLAGLPRPWVSKLKPRRAGAR